MRKSATILCLTSFALFAAHAAAKEGARVTYYPVQGGSAKEVYESIRDTSPKVAPNATFAFTAIATKTDSKFNKTEGGCTYRSFKTYGYYVFYVPKHANPGALPAGTLRNWRDFTSYLLLHEQGHRDIWRQCLTNYDAEALNLSASSCEDLDKRRERTFERIKRGCVRKDEAYDFEFRKEVRKQPFVAEALQGN